MAICDLDELACEYLARVGFLHLLLDYEEPCIEEGDESAIAEALRARHSYVLRKLIASTPEPIPNSQGLRWIVRVTWPDRVPGLVTWSGQQSLSKIIVKNQVQLRKQKPGCNLYELRTYCETSSGIDARACPNSIDLGFNPRRHGILIEQRPAMELLAIVGLETLPLLSFGFRRCGFLHDGKAWMFEVETRDGGYYHRWGQVKGQDEWQNH